MAVLSGKTKGLFVPLILLGLFLALPRTAFANWINDADTDWYTSNTSASTFTITTEEELAGLAKLVNDNTEDFSGKTIELAGDLDLGGRDWTPIGNAFAKPFKGNFDGKGFAIDNLTIGTANAPASYDYAGLFGNVNGGTIKNLGVINCAVYSNTHQMASTGGLVGRNGGDITNCCITGQVIYSGSSNISIGGLAGETVGSSIITNCYADVTLFVSTSTFTHTGGLVGENYGAITNCYVTGNVQVSAQNHSIYTGGLAGHNVGSSSAITNCYATGQVSASGSFDIYTGGLVGFNHYQSTITQGYFNRDGANNSLDGIGRDDNNTPQEGNITAMALADMKTQSFTDILEANMSGWAWDPAKNHGLPYLDNGMWVVDTPTGGNNGGNNNNNGGSYNYTSGGDSDRDNRDQSAGGVRADYVYRIAFDTQGGGSVATQRVREGRYAEEPDDPIWEGYSFTGWFTDKSCTKEYDFGKKVTASLTLYAGWEPIEMDAPTAEETPVMIPETAPETIPWQNPFADVHEGDWFYDSVAYVCEKGFMAGTGNGLFSPEQPVTRAMAVAILYPMDHGANFQRIYSFTDLTQEWYGNGVYWAADKGIAAGYSGGLFGPDDPITREQFAVMLYQFARYQKLDVSGGADLSGYTDVDSVSGYALEAMTWANTHGIITGRGQNELAPQGTATRAEAAAILQRFYEGFIEGQQ